MEGRFWYLKNYRKIIFNKLTFDKNKIISNEVKNPVKKFDIPSNMLLSVDP